MVGGGVSVWGGVGVCGVLWWGSVTCACEAQQGGSHGGVSVNNNGSPS